MEVYHEKRMRTLICLVLVVLLTASMAVPAMADNASGQGTAVSIDYKWELSYTTAAANASITTPNVPSPVTATVEGYVYYDLTGDYGYTDEVTLCNYRSVTVSSGNIITINDVPVRGEVRGAVGSFWVGGTQVINEAHTGVNG